MSKEKFVRDKPHVNIGLIITIFSFLSIASVGILIYNDIKILFDSDGDSINDYDESRSEIPLYIEATSNSLDYRSFLTDTSSETQTHEVGHHLGINHGIISHLEINSHLYDDVSSGNPILNFSWRYESVIEFFDEDGDGYFESSIDTVLGLYPILNMTRVAFRQGIGGQPALYSEYISNDGQLTVEFFTTEEHVLLSRGIGMLAPNDLKSLLKFSDYSPLTNETGIVLNISIQSSSELLFSDSKVNASEGEYRAEYEWLDWAIKDGINGTVNITVPTSANPGKGASIYINLGNFQNATYDPHYYPNIPTRNAFSLIEDIPWPYVALSAVSVLMVSVGVKTARKKYGRVKYGEITLEKKHSHGNSTSDAEKRIPAKLQHKNR